MVAQFTADGILDVQSHYADPAHGRGTLSAAERGLNWEIPKLLRPRIDGAKWAEMHTFGRSNGKLNIAWTKRDFNDGEFGPEMMGALLFEGSTRDAERIANMASKYLSDSNWREPWIDPDGNHWDSMWARSWTS